MKISLTVRNMEGESWQKEYVDERLNKMKKYIDRPVDAHVILSVEKFRNVAEVNMIADGLNINAKEEAKDMHLAIDDAVDKIEKQLKKHKEKMRGHKTSMTRAEGITVMGEMSEEMEAGP
ncbi:MAG: ribosome-associated translation inhibitor RaiA [Syntrophales bacterium]|nr:ribosome-associated translation inhibitor RaiA [Syntrophales bacterium]